MENLKLPLFRLKLLTSAILFSSLVNVFFSQQYTIVNGNTTNQDIPIDPFYDYTICQTIYEQSLLTNAGASPGQITHLSWEYYAGTGTHNEEIVIYMGNTMQDDYASSSSWIDAKTLTLVYQGPASFTATGWSQITLQTPFNWDGSNLCIMVNSILDGYSSSSNHFYVASATGNRTIDKHKDDSFGAQYDVNAPPSGDQTAYQPSLKLTLVSGPNASGSWTSGDGAFTACSGGAASSDEQYTINASNLSGNLTATPPAGFEISLTSGSGYVSSPSTLTIPQANAEAGDIIYVRMAAGSSNPTTANLSIDGGGLSSAITTSLSGSYTSAPAQPGTISGDNPLCSSTNTAYTISSVTDATSYNWSYSGTGSVTGSSTTGTLNASSVGTISVTASNSCGTSSARDLLLSLQPSTLYVDPTGTDGAGYGSSTGSNAYATLSFAVSQACSGSTINVAAGTYTDEDITISTDNLTITGAGNSTIFDGVSVELLKLSLTSSLTFFLEYLEKNDPDVLEKIDIKNKRRVQRAWEVLKATNKSILYWQSNNASPLVSSDATLLLVEIERESLAKRISARVDFMLESGAIKEVEKVYKTCWDINLPFSKAIGAQDIISYLNNGISLDKLTQNIGLKTRQFAKRQRTWHRNYMKNWISIDPSKINSSSIQEIVKKVKGSN